MDKNRYIHNTGHDVDTMSQLNLIACFGQYHFCSCIDVSNSFCKAVKEKTVQSLMYWQETQKKIEEKLKCCGHRRNKSVGAQQLAEYVGHVMIKRYKEVNVQLKKIRKNI